MYLKIQRREEISYEKISTNISQEAYIFNVSEHKTYLQLKVVKVQSQLKVECQKFIDLKMVRN